ncbi:MAG: amino acid permease, partial [Candidatus Omnitrophica bacterium]|nr:amino acid permease [Candidatus Omnitrophota bacterium]
RYRCTSSVREGAPGNSEESESRLKRVLGLPDATALVVGCIIGAGIFRMASPIAKHLQSVPAILGVWILGGVVSFLGALCYAELGAAYPKAGGDYVYLTRAYGRLTGFLFGWTKVFIERTGTIAILAFVFAEYLGGLTGYSEIQVKIAAILAVVFLTLANLVGVRWGSTVQNVATILKVAALGLIIILGGFFGPTATAAATAAPQSMNQALSSLGMAFVFVMWTYGGWTESAYIAEEMKNPQRDLPWSILLGLGLTTALYLIVNVVYMKVIPVAEMPEHRLVAAEVMRRTIGPWGKTLTSAMVMISAFGALNGYILTSARILMAMGQDHALFRSLGKIHSRWATPSTALWVNGGCAIALVCTGTLDQIVTYSTVAISIFYGMTAIAVIILRRKDPDLPRPYKMRGYPVVPILSAVAMAWLVADVLIKQPFDVMIGLGLLAAALPLYAYPARR